MDCKCATEANIKLSVCGIIKSVVKESLHGENCCIKGFVASISTVNTRNIFSVCIYCSNQISGLCICTVSGHHKTAYLTLCLHLPAKTDTLLSRVWKGDKTNAIMGLNLGRCIMLPIVTSQRALYVSAQTVWKLEQTKEVAGGLLPFAE